MYLGNYGLAKRGLDKYLKSAISQNPSTSNIVKTLKHGLDFVNRDSFTQPIQII